MKKRRELLMFRVGEGRALQIPRALNGRPASTTSNRGPCVLRGIKGKNDPNGVRRQGSHRLAWGLRERTFAAVPAGLAASANRSPRWSTDQCPSPTDQDG